MASSPLKLAVRFSQEVVQLRSSAETALVKPQICSIDTAIWAASGRRVCTHCTVELLEHKLTIKLHRVARCSIAQVGKEITIGPTSIFVSGSNKSHTGNLPKALDRFWISGNPVKRAVRASFCAFQISLSIFCHLSSIVMGALKS